MKNLKIVLLVFITSTLATSFKVNRSELRDTTSGPAYAVTWQNNAGYWFAVGPVQPLWAGEKTEALALDYVIGSKAKKAKKLKFLKVCGKFKVYSLGVDYEEYDTDALKYVRKKGYDCEE